MSFGESCENSRQPWIMNLKEIGNSMKNKVLNQYDFRP
jgi:hypothetical protein